MRLWLLCALLIAAPSLGMSIDATSTAKPTVTAALSHNPTTHNTTNTTDATTPANATSNTVTPATAHNATTDSPTTSIDVTIDVTISTKASSSVTTVSPSTKPVSPSSNVTTPSMAVSSTSGSAEQKKQSKFDAGSFVGGIVLTLGIMIVLYLGCKFYATKRGVQYRTIDEHEAII